MSGNPYESDPLLAQYLLFHYGEEEHQLPWGCGPVSALNFPARCVSEGLDLDRLPAHARALDLGCAVGRSTFELSRVCAEVRGIDASERFVEVAAILTRDGGIDAVRMEEGSIEVPVRYTLPEGVHSDRVQFRTGDAVRPETAWGTFDVVLMANLVDRVPDPEACLENTAGLVRPGGQLILTTPFTWLETYTPSSRWLGGFTRDGEPVSSWDRLQEILAPQFDLVTAWDMPFLIREHARKFQWSVAQAGRWIRREDAHG